MGLITSFTSFTNNFYTRVNDVKNSDRLNSQEANNQLEVLKLNYNILTKEAFDVTVMAVCNVALLTFLYATSASWDVILVPQCQLVPILIKASGTVATVATASKFLTCTTICYTFSVLSRNQIQFTKNEREFGPDFRDALNDIESNIRVISKVKNTKSTIPPGDKKNV